MESGVIRPRNASSRIAADRSDGREAGHGEGEAQALVQRAIAASQAGRLGSAARLCRAALEKDARADGALHLLGTLAFRRRDHRSALAFFEAAERIRPVANHVWARGAALEGLNRLDEAAEAYRCAIAFNPDDADGQASLEIALRRLERFEEAAAALRHAARLAPERAAVHDALALTLRRLGRFIEAAEAARTALALNPNHATAHSNLGHALLGLKRFAEAAAAFGEATRCNSADAEAHTNWGAALLGMNRFKEAAVTCAEAVRLAPGDANAHANLGFALAALDRLDEAVAACVEAIRLAPNHANAHANLGFALIGLARFEAAVAELETAIALNAGHMQARRNLAMVLLLLGRFERGWTAYEHRGDHLVPEGQRAVFHAGGERVARSRWRGEPLAGRTILLHTEQGLGDTVQFVRYVPEVARRGGQVLLLVQPVTERLLRDLPGVHRLLTFGQNLPNFELHCPLPSLPQALAMTTPDTIPVGVPYLRADPERRERWRQRLGNLRGLRVGLSWAGNPEQGNDRNRSVAFRHLAPLWQVPGVDWISLQVGPRAADLGDAPAGVIRDLAPHLHDLAETAAVMSQLDLVLTVDTMVAHLAGALGQPAFVMLAFVADWRWLLARDDSPWYPTLRLFRQKRAGAWDSVIERVAVALKDVPGADAVVGSDKISRF